MSATASMPRSGGGNAPNLRLGLIGSNIRMSRSPDLHRICGELTGLSVAYDLLIPAERGEAFDTVFDACARSGMRGVNITYPYKERVVGKLDVLDAHAASVGAVNTVVFESSRLVGYNTDYTGFIAAYREAFGETSPGRVALIGAGGVGRAIAFALVELGASDLQIFDRDGAKATGLAQALLESAWSFRAIVCRDVAEAVATADGVINATPVGMVGHEQSPVPSEYLGAQRWAFDAVYTPAQTIFRTQAERAGLKFLGGYALFFHQGIEAFQLFAGRKPTDLVAVHRRLEQWAHAERIGS